MPSTTPNYALPYPVAADTADIPRDMQALAVKLDGMPALTRPPLVTSLPGSPADGQECYYQADAANGVIWHLRYRAAAGGSFKWECVGGPPLWARQVSAAATASTTYVAIDGPQVAVPLAGVYDVRLMIYGYGAQAGVVAYAAVKNGAAAPTDDDAAVLTSTGVTAQYTLGIERMYTIAAGALVTVHFKAAGGTANFPNRSLAITPVRVG